METLELTPEESSLLSAVLENELEEQNYIDSDEEIDVITRITEKLNNTGEGE